MGAERAAAACDQLLQAGADALLSWGSAAALRADIKPGTPLCPASVLAGNGARLEVDSGWWQAASDPLQRLIGQAVLTTPLAESPGLLASVEAKRALQTATQAGVADMESAAIGRAALAAGRPWLVLRVAADGADTALPSPISAAMDATGHIRLSQVLWQSLRQPAAWRALGRLAGDARQAQRSAQRLARGGLPRQFWLKTV